MSYQNGLKSKQEVIGAAVGVLSTGRDYLGFGRVRGIDYKEVLAKASEIATTQARIKNLILADKGRGLKRIVARSRVALRPDDYDLERLMEAQTNSITFVRAGLEQIKSGVGLAREFTQTYWGQLIDIPRKVATKEQELLAEIEQLTTLKQQLDEQHYNKEAETAKYFDNLRQKREVERRLKAAIREQKRLSIFSREVELQAMRIDDILEYLCDVESFATDWHMKVTLAHSDITYIREILPLVSQDATALKEIIEVSDNIITNTRDLTAHELGKRYATLQRMGLAPFAILASPGAYPELEQLLQSG
ncbi:hypothetical protein DRJ48_04520 [Candidatus Woesearchaeota archaeon]|nr:hypothetical protein [Candidatus Woesearchaeota archaeon]RLE41967.1 MAG: hypothetical protein DRJ48_04520 [Candidatus Woesearchaeota archaeon]